jgi:CpeT protein
MNKVIVISCFFVLCCICDTSAQPLTSDTTLRRLVMYMEGSFSSQKQSLSDTSYYDIRLHIKRIWNNRNDAYWLYVEQAVAKFIEKPYRQRIYKVTRLSSDTLVSSVYEMYSPLRFAGAWKDPNLLFGITPDSIVERKGCSVFLVKNSNGDFVGGTKPTTCCSDLRGARYATSEVTITRKVLLSWDRGWGAKGEHIWGATKGGYEFVKLED